MQALSDVTILDLTHHIAGPYCTKMLADYGANVIKLEKPGSGDVSRSMGPFPEDIPHPEKSGIFLHLNSNKRGITLDFKTNTGKNMFLELVKHVDVVIESFSPSTLSSAGLSYEVLEKVNPKVILVSISNFGQNGPYRDYKATEIVLHGMGGNLHSLGIPEREPTNKAINMMIATVDPAISNVNRAPNMIRLNSSLPKWSVPRRNSADGGSSRLSRFKSVGSFSGSQGARKAVRIAAATMMNPSMAPGSWRMRSRADGRRAVWPGIPSTCTPPDLIQLVALA